MGGNVLNMVSVNHLHEALRHRSFLGEGVDDYVNCHLHLSEFVLALYRFSVTQAQAEVDANQTAFYVVACRILPSVLVFIGTRTPCGGGCTSLELEIGTENGVIVRKSL